MLFVKEQTFCHYLQKSPNLFLLLLFTNQSIPASLSWYSPTLWQQAFPGPRTFPPSDVQQGHPLLPMFLEPIGPSIGTFFSIGYILYLHFISLFLDPHPPKVPHALFPPPVTPSTPSHFPVLVFPYTVASSLFSLQEGGSTPSFLSDIIWYVDCFFGVPRF